MQFQKSKKPLYCVFDIDASLTHHRRQAAVVLEGKYWKRKLSAVATEYRKWRLYYKEKNKMRKIDPALRAVQERGNAVFDDICRNFKPQMMQVNSVRPPFLHNLDAIPESIFPNFTKDSPDAIATMDFMIQQPNLEVLNPTTLDDFLDKMEPMEVMLTQVINSTLDMGQSSLSTPFTGGGATSSTQPYATPTPTQPPLSDGQYSTSGYPNGSYMAGFTSSAATLSQPQQQQRAAQGYPLSPSSFLDAQGKGSKSTSGPDLSGIPGSNYSMKNEGMAYPSQQEMVFGSYAQQQQQQQQQMAPPPHQDYGAMNRTGMTSPPDTNYSMAMKDETSMGTMGQFLNQFLSDPLNPSQVPTDSSQCYQQPANQAQQALPSSNMFQFPTSPLQQQQNQQFESGTLSSLLQQSSAGATGDSANQNSIARVSSAGNLGLLTEESSTPPIRPPLSRGRSEPIRHLQQQVKHLAEENQRQMMEIEKQQSIAEQQYMAVLQQLAEQQASGKASQEQQRVLKSVLSDPGLVSILRDVLLANPPPVALQERGGIQQQQQQQQQQRERLQPLNVTPSKMSTDSQVSSTPSPLISPSQASQGHMYGFSVGLSGSTSSMPSTPSAIVGASKGGSIQLGELDSFMAMQAQKKFKSSRHMSTEEKEVFKEIRRQSHISAEQKRRGSIKHGFSQLQSMVVNLASYPSGKVSKATILEKTIEHIQHVHIEREEREKQIESFKRQIEDLNASIAQCQEQLPAAGVPITRQRFEENRQRFRDYIQRRTLQNYKFWIFSLILQQLFESYNSMVSTGSVDELCRTVLAWFEQYCTLPALRPVVMDSLRELSQKTSILTDPAQVPHQLAQFAQQDLQQSQQAQQVQRLKSSHTAPAGIFS